MYNGKLQYIVKTFQLTFKNKLGVFQPKSINVLVTIDLYLGYL
jgi:hypothetical protein